MYEDYGSAWERVEPVDAIPTTDSIKHIYKQQITITNKYK